MINIKVLAARYKIKSDEAFDMLLAYGQRVNQRVLTQQDGEVYYPKWLDEEMERVDSDLQTLVIPKAKIEENLQPCHLKLQPFVYFLYDKDELVYVGQSRHVPARVNSHRDDKTFDRVAAFPSTSLGVLEVEYANIRHYRPRYNKAGVTTLAGRLKDILGRCST